MMKRKESTKNKDVDTLKNQLARLLADYDNLRKRTEEERRLWIKFAAERILTKLLPLLDILDAAQKHLNDQGLGIAINEFRKVLGEEGVEEIKSDGEFDEKVHEAVETVEAPSPEGLGPGGVQKGKIAEVVLTGWKFKDGPIIRAAKVKVFGKKSEREKELNKEMARGDYM